jgi:hypothetical protein
LLQLVNQITRLADCIAGLHGAAVDLNNQLVSSLDGIPSC